MEIEVTDGLNIISIGVNDLASYLRFQHPVTMVWNTGEDKMINYICQLPYDDMERRSYFDQLQGKLTLDFTNRTEELQEILKPLFRLFPNGKYELDFNNGIKQEEEATQLEERDHPKWQIQYAFEVSDVKNTNTLIDENKIRWEKIEDISESDMTGYTTSKFYYDRGSHYMATQPESNLDDKRVQYFEERIRNNERPFAIIMCFNDRETYAHSQYFVLDGHHTLQAYHNLKMVPPLALITRDIFINEKVEFDIEQIAERLYPWQVRHILNHWEDKQDHIPELIKRADSKIKAFIRNGDFKEYYQNGKLKFEGFYINDTLEGPVKKWHANGKLQYEGYYTRGIKTAIWKHRYSDGRIEYLRSYDDEGKDHGDHISYHYNGTMISKRSYVHGVQDGYGFYINHNGKLQYEHWYENGKRIASKDYDKDGNVTTKVTRATSKKYDPMPPLYIEKEPVLNLETVDHTAPKSYNKYLFQTLLFLAWVIYKVISNLK